MISNLILVSNEIRKCDSDYGHYRVVILLVSVDILTLQLKKQIQHNNFNVCCT